MTAPLRICHVLPTFTVGGRERRIAALINALGGEAVHVIAALDNRYDALDLVNAREQVARATLPAGLRHVPAAMRALGDLRPDLLLTYNWGSMDFVAAGLAARVCPIIHTEDGFGHDEAKGPHRRRALLRRLLLNRVYAVVVPSHSLAALALARFRVHPGKLVFIPNGVDVDRFSPGRRRDWRRAQGIADDEVVFGTVATLRPEKNLSLLLEAFARCTPENRRLVIVGDGECLSGLQSTAERLGVSHQVVFAGARRDVRTMLAACDVFVLSSSTEQMPVALLEAMAMGLPAICTGVGDCADLLGTHEPPAIVPPGDVAAYVEAMERMHGDAGLRRRAGEANRARAVSRYSAERMIACYRRLYLLASGRSDVRLDGDPAMLRYEGAR